MHSPIIFALTESSAALPKLKTALSKSEAVQSFDGVISDDIFDQLEIKMGADWWHDTLDATDYRSYEVLEILKSYKGTLTKETDQFSWWELTAQQCREAMQEALDAQLFILQTCQDILKNSELPLNVKHPTITQGLSDQQLLSRLYVAIDKAEGFTFSARTSGGVAFAVVEEWGAHIMTFGELIAQSVSEGTGLRLAVATDFNGDYHF